LYVSYILRGWGRDNSCACFYDWGVYKCLHAGMCVNTAADKSVTVSCQYFHSYF